MNVHNKKQQGQAIVEMAVALPLFLLLLVGTAEMGILIHDHISLQIGAREGARIAATGASAPEIQQMVQQVTTITAIKHFCP